VVAGRDEKVPGLQGEQVWLEGAARAVENWPGWHVWHVWLVAAPRAVENRPGRQA